MWQRPHFATGFCEETVVFWAAFFGAGFDSIRAKGDKIAGDGQEHFIDEKRKGEKGSVIHIDTFDGGRDGD